jgi:hypothetical protein
MVSDERVGGPSFVVERGVAPPPLIQTCFEQWRALTGAAATDAVGSDFFGANSEYLTVGELER